MIRSTLQVLLVLIALLILGPIWLMCVGIAYVGDKQAKRKLK